MTHEGLRTATAQQAMAITEVVNRSLTDKAVGNDPPKRLQIRDVDGPSTDGGKRSRQSIVLAPVDGAPEGSVMCGWVDTARGEAELRAHAVVARQHVERYRRPFDVTEAEYVALAAELRDLLALGSVDVRMSAEAEGPAAARAPRSPAATLAVGFALLALASIAFALLR